MKLANCNPLLRQRIQAQINDEDYARTKVSDTESCQREIPLEGHCQREAQGTGCPAVSFTLCRVKLLDVDARYSSIKDVLDGCTIAGLIPGDREGQITLQVEQVRVAHFKDEKTVVTIEYPCNSRLTDG